MCLKKIKAVPLRNYIIAAVFVFCTETALGVSDTLVFHNGNMIVGEIEKMERGVLEIDAAYGDANFKIEWLSVKEIYSDSKFLVNVHDRIYYGRLASLPDRKVSVYSGDSVFIVCMLDEVIYLSQIKEGFSDRFSASVELGFDVAKAQNMRQLSTRSSLGYRAENWSTDGSYNSLRSNQDNTDPIQRSDGELNYRYILARKWYVITTFSALSNTEQKLDIRTNAQLGMGNYIYNTNKAYWGIKIGANNNYEKFSNETESRNSWEGYLGTEVNLFDMGDIDLLLVFMGYTGLSDLSRYRSDMNFDLKYDLPFDLFVRLGISFNYDNKPAESASKTDYVFRTGIGWEW